MGSTDQNRPGALHIGRVDVSLVEGAVSAIVTIEDQREGLFVADAKQDKRGQADGIGMNACDIDAFSSALFSDEPTHVLIADSGD